MAYLDVLTLEDTKNYLRIDDTLNDDDIRIKSMIKSSLSMLERRTNILVFARDKDYIFQDYCVRVYDYPINSLLNPLEADVKEKELYSIYTTNKKDNTKLTLNVGYTDTDDVPNELIECALEYIKYMYYDSENNNGKSNNIPLYIDNMINQLKRFII